MLPANSNAHIFGKMIEKDKGIKRLKKENCIKDKRNKDNKNKKIKDF